MAITTSKAIQWVPSAAAGASVTPANTAWTSSSWVELIASTSGAIQLDSIVISTPLATIEYEIDIGTGTAGNEVVVGTIRGSNTSLSTGEDYLQQRFGIVIDNIASGVRVSTRLRKQGTSTTAWTVALGYYAATDSTDVTTNAQLTLPSAADPISLTPGGAWTSSTYGQLTASIGNDIWFTGLSFNPPTATEFELDVATGGAGSETVVTTLRSASANGTGLGYIMLPHPLKIASGSRIAIRHRQSSSNTTAWTYGAMYYVQETLTPLTPNVTDTLATSENVVRTLVGLVSLSDSSTATESVTPLVQFLLVNVSDTAASSEAVSMNETSFVNKSDSSALTESVALVFTSLIFVSDTVTATENVQPLNTLNAAGSDSTTLSEAVITLLTALVNVNDSTSATETITMLNTSSVNVSDSTAGSEVLKLLQTSFVNTSEPVTLTESVTVLVPFLVVNTSDTAASSEAILLQDQDGIAVLDSVALAESVTPLIPFLLVGVSDSATASESVTLQPLAFVNVSDSLTTTESLQLLETSTINVSDTGTLTESVGRLLTALITANDTSTLSESTSFSIFTGGLSITDSLTISEATTVRLLITINVNDSTALSESLGRTEAFNINVSDGIGVSEFVYTFMDSDRYFAHNTVDWEGNNATSWEVNNPSPFETANNASWQQKD